MGGRPDISFGAGEGSEHNVRTTREPGPCIKSNPKISTCNLHKPQARPNVPPQANAIPQAQHLRRESSQSAHSDMGNPAFNNRGYQGGGRGRANFNPGYNAAMGHSPQPSRSLPFRPNNGGGMPPAFQPGGMAPNSPFRHPRSPAVTAATPYQQPHMPNGPAMPYTGYPPYQQVRNPSSTSVKSPFAHESTTTDAHQSPLHVAQNGAHSMAFGVPSNERNAFLRDRPVASALPFLLSSSSPSPPFSTPSSVATTKFDQYLTTIQQQTPYGQPQMDMYGGYYNQHPYMQPQMQYPMQSSPRPGQVYPQPMPGYAMPAYPQQPGAMPMSRTPSQLSERPPSAAAQPSTPAMANVSHVSHTPTQSVGTSPAPTAPSFVPPAKKSKAITIKNEQGEVINFDNKKAASPAPPPQPRSPAIVSTPGGPTPPPRAPSVADSSHSRTDSTATKTVEEKRADFVKEFQQKLAIQAEPDKKTQDKDAEAEAKKKAAQEEVDDAAKQEAEKAAKEQAEKEAKEEAEKAEKAAKDKEAEDARLAAEAEERMIAEMEALEREEEERERKYAEKKKAEAEAKKAREAEERAREDERLRELERAAEEAEAKRAAGGDQDSESLALFRSLKKNTQFGPQAGATDSGASTPPAEPTPAPAPAATQPKAAPAAKPRPANLKLETTKSVEPAQPSAAMLSLKSARFLQIRDEAINYPDGIKSPNPALNMGAKKGRQYDKEFLLQFQPVFKEKPSTDWDQKLRETVGDSPDTRPPSARPMGSRQPSSRGGPPPMGSFVPPPGGRTLPVGTTSEQRFQQSSQGARPQQAGMSNPFAHLVGGARTGSFPMGRTPSFQDGGRTPSSPRVGSGRGRGSRRGDKPGGKQEEQLAKAMPLTANLDPAALKLERSQTGWKPHGGSTVMPSGHMAPDMVQRKVKAALNKMTPEKFEKIADQIQEIAAQSKDENDGRTLRQVIQLTFEKACDEAHWASMYAKFAERMLRTMSPDIKDDNVKDRHGNPVVGGALFRKYLLNRCQEEFERGWEVNLPEKPEGQDDAAVMLSDEYYIAAAAKRKGLGLIQFIGELYKLRMLTLRIMHECVLKLLDFEGMPDESAIESLVKLLRTVGSTMEQEESGPKMLQVYFERIQKIMNYEGLPSRLKFMLLDIVDLRKAGWKSKDANKGPKTIAEIHQEAAAAQQAQEMERARTSQRGGPRMPMGRGDARSFSGGGMMPPQDYPSGRVQMDDLRKLSKGASGRNLTNSGQLGPSLLGSRQSSRRGLGPGGLVGRGDESGASSRTGTPPQKERESTTHVNSFR